MKTFYIHTFFFHSFTTLFLARGFSGITGSRIIAFTGFYLKSAEKWVVGTSTTTPSSKLDVGMIPIGYPKLGFCDVAT